MPYAVKRKDFSIVLIVVFILLILLTIFLFACEKLDFKREIKINTGTVSNPTSNSALITSKILDIGDNEITKYGHCWSNSEINPTIKLETKTEKGIRKTRGEFNDTLTNLLPETMYYVRAYATNPQDTCYGVSVNFTTLGIPPVAAFTATPTTISTGQSVQFTDQSANTPTSWSWTFGDGGTSTSQNPSHTYSTAGTYTVTLTATNSYGSDLETKSDYIIVNAAGNKPMAAFTATPTTITAGQSVQFTDQSSNAPTSWSWTFGDGGTSTSQNPSHMYSTAGTYTVTLTATNSFGSDLVTKSNYIIVNTAGSKPVAAFSATPTTLATGQSVQFTDQSANTPTSWSWNFGDGGTSTSQNPSHTYTSAGTYTVTLIATNSYGSDDETKSNYITVGNKPVAAFTATPTTLAAGQSVQFTDQSTNTPTSWSWTFGDGVTSTSKNPSHTYASAGTYTVTLTASNSYGSDGETKSNYITVGNKPVAAFSGAPTTLIVSQSVQFTDQSTNSPTSWSWTFGDGGTSTSQNPSHTYTSAGTYTVTLTATNSYGSDDETKSNYITVGNKPVAAFTATPTTLAAGQSVQFTDQSTNTPTSWSWTFGDGGTSGSQNPSHTYLTAGTYTVKLTVVNIFGSGSETKTNYVTVNLCPSSLTVIHQAGNVAPVTKTVTYGVVESNLSGQNKCWITKNLGANNQAGSGDDDTEAAAGWYWQFNRKQGYKHDGTIRTPNTTWIDSIDENSNWTSANDPCTILLGAGWRVPTGTEWNNVYNNSGWSNIYDAYASVLKLHAAGDLLRGDGSLFFRGIRGFFRGSVQNNYWGSWNLYIDKVSIYMYENDKAYGFPVRCLKD
jgi:PKD repeat protein